MALVLDGYEIKCINEQKGDILLQLFHVIFFPLVVSPSDGADPRKSIGSCSSWSGRELSDYFGL